MNRHAILSYNRQAWNVQVDRGNRWTVPVDHEAIVSARSGRPQIVLTPTKLVPPSWFPALHDCPTLMLAAGGGQQSPIMAAAGARVTVVDLSEKQLRQDELVASREGLELTTIQASMDDLSMLDDASFNLVVHPCSNSFVPSLQPVWKEIARVTRPGARLMTGFCNPLIFLFEESNLQHGKLEAIHRLPYSDNTSLPKETLQRLLDQHEPLMFGHSLTEQIGEQLAAGFCMRGLYEDFWGNSENVAEGYQLLDSFTPSFIATLCERLPD